MKKYIFHKNIFGGWLRGKYHETRSASRHRRLKKDGKILPRLVKPYPDRRGIALVIIVKDEAPYIAEWIVFHCMLGVRHVYVYDNMSSDGLADAIGKSGYQSSVTVIRWGSLCKRQQDVAYNHAVATFGAKYRWMGFFDIDEFVIPLKEDSFEDVFKHFEGQPCVALPWHMFGTSGHEDPPSGLVIENYVMREPFPPDDSKKVRLAWKIFVDPSKVHLMYIHHAVLDKLGETRMMQSGDLMKRYLPYWENNPARFLASPYLQLNHYYTRSNADFMQKIARRSVATSGMRDRSSRMKRRFAIIEKSPVRDDAALRFVDEVKARLETYKSNLNKFNSSDQPSL